MLDKVVRVAILIRSNTGSPGQPIHKLGHQRMGIVRQHLHDVEAPLEHVVRGLVVIPLSISPERQKILDHR